MHPVHDFVPPRIQIPAGIAWGLVEGYCVNTHGVAKSGTECLTYATQAPRLTIAEFLTQLRQGSHP